jgi:NodT family efflux transporter outer membrane factor (OMF) lipoprotein
MKRAVFTIAALATITAGCAVGPDYVSPEIDDEADWVAPKDDRQQSAAPPAQWWSLLDDEELDRQLQMAAEHNLDIQAAVARVDEVRALRGVARSVFWPQMSTRASYTRFEQSLESPGAAGSLIEAGLVDRDIDFYSTGLDASWELDLFGGNRRRAEAANAALGASIAGRNATILAILAETASAWFELRGAQQRLSITQRNTEAQRKMVDLTRRKVKAGLGRRIDQLRAEAQLDAIEASVPALRAAIRASSWRLAVLTGRRPEEMTDYVAIAGSLPAAPQAPPIGMRADVLRRRPDIAIAERQLGVATAEVGVAKSEFFPKLQLSGNFGFESADVSDLGAGRSRTSALVPFVSWPIFQGGRLRAGLEGADARARVAALSYEKAVLTALADAESAISAYTEELQTHENLSAAADASREAAEIAQKLYEKGLADFLTVLDAERRRDENEDARAQSHTRLLLNLVRVYKSLGGGWAMNSGSA